jgi:spoIIIJ-associated protein
MYDIRSEAKEFMGETAADARAKAVSFFGIDESEITFQELASSEVSGAGGRTVIVAQPTEMVGKVAQGGGGGNRSTERERPGRDRERGSGRERSGRGRGDREPRGRGDREPREARGREDREPREARGREDREPREARPERDREPRPAPAEPSVGTPQGDLGPVGEFILGVIERMDLGPFEVTESQEGRFVVYQLAGVAAEELTAADGRATEAIQLLANQAAGRLSDEPMRIVVDAEGDRERREEFLGRMAERAARRAQDTTRAVALDPMNARDRRGIHMALREMEGVATMSVGEGRYRQVVVVPEGADEYEEALNNSPDSSPDAQEEEE